MIRHSPDALILRHRPLALSTALGAGAALLMALGLWNLAGDDGLRGAIALLTAAGLSVPAAWSAFQSTEVRFDAAKGTCTIHARTLTGRTEEVYPLSDIDKAVLQTHHRPGDAASAHRLALAFHSGDSAAERPLTNGYSTGPQTAALVSRINAWLEKAATGRGA